MFVRTKELAVQKARLAAPFATAASLIGLGLWLATGVRVATFASSTESDSTLPIFFSNVAMSSLTYLGMALAGIALVVSVGSNRLTTSWLLPGILLIGAASFLLPAMVVVVGFPFLSITMLVVALAAFSAVRPATGPSAIAYSVAALASFAVAILVIGPVDFGAAERLEPLSQLAALAWLCGSFLPGGPIATIESVEAKPALVPVNFAAS